MKILAVSDIESKRYYDHYTPGRLDGFDLILACGDLKAPYLDFLMSMSHCPLVYVRGNHDDGFLTDPPAGAICAEDRVVECQGLRILGLGGSYRYRDGRNMFTEREMAARALAVTPQIWRHRGFDVLLTHAPARGVNDFDTLAHRGFQCFNTLLDRYQPPLFVHGHIHQSYGRNIPRETWRGKTLIVNACDHRVIEWNGPA